MKLIAKYIPYAAVIISLFAGYLTFQRVNPDAFLKKEGPPVTMDQISENAAKSYAGKTAGPDIPRLVRIGDFDAMAGAQYATAEPSKVIATGIYSLKPWVDPYEVTKGKTSGGRLYSTGRRAPDATDNPLTAPDAYQEYYLIQLPDDTYILAQFSDSYRRAIERGEKVILPIGEKKANSSRAVSYLKKACEPYGASPDSSLYMIDDTWYQDHDFSMFMIKFAAAAVVFFVLAVGLMVVAKKAFKRK